MIFNRETEPTRIHLDSICNMHMRKLNEELDLDLSVLEILKINKHAPKEYRNGKLKVKASNLDGDYYKTVMYLHDEDPRLCTVATTYLCDGAPKVMQSSGWLPEVSNEIFKNRQSSRVLSNNFKFI